jgi:hypothetical protein
MSYKKLGDYGHSFDAPALESESTVGREISLGSPFTSAFRWVGESPVLVHSNNANLFAPNHTLDSMRDLRDGSLMSWLPTPQLISPILPQKAQAGEYPTNQVLNSPSKGENYDSGTMMTEMKRITLQLNPEILPQQPQDQERHTGKVSPPEDEKSQKKEKKNHELQRKKIQKSMQKQDHAVEKVFKKQREGAFSRRETKNIVKDYGKASATFSLSQVGEPYLKKILLKYQLTSEVYRTFMINKRETISSIDGFRELIYADPKFCSPDTEDYKMRSVFREMCEIFIRDFAVNWIFDSKSKFKHALLAYRFRLLRRMQDPANFTYLL